VTSRFGFGVSDELAVLADIGRGETVVGPEGAGVEQGAAPQPGPLALGVGVPPGPAGSGVVEEERPEPAEIGTRARCIASTCMRSRRGACQSSSSQCAISVPAACSQARLRLAPTVAATAAGGQ
jgi:hypothetical protein